VGLAFSVTADGTPKLQRAAVVSNVAQPLLAPNNRTSVLARVAEVRRYAAVWNRSVRIAVDNQNGDRSAGRGCHALVGKRRGKNRSRDWRDGSDAAGELDGARWDIRLPAECPVR